MSICEISRHQYYDNRSKSRNPKDDTAPELFLTTSGQCEEYLNMRFLYQDHLDEKIASSLHPNQHFFNILKYKKHVELKSQWDVSNLLPRKQTLTTTLRIDQVSSETWLQPNLSQNRRSSMFTLSAFSCVEFDRLGFRDQMKVFGEISQDAKDMILNSNCCPFSVETIRVPKPVYRELAKLKSTGRSLAFEYDPQMHKDYIEVPVKLFVGCGRNGAICINFGFSEWNHLDSKIDDFGYNFESSSIPDEILKFLKDLPPLYSVDAKKQARSLISMLEDLYDVNMKLRVFDLGALAVANGCKMDDFSLFSLSAIVKNEPFPADLSSMDQKWAGDWDSLEKVMKSFVGDKFQLMFDIYIILSGLLLRNVFPDPDVVLSTMEISQSTFVPWWSHFVALALSEADISKPTHDISTRLDMILRMGPDTGLLGVLADLMIRVPVANFGGERFLHHARYHFLLKQYYVISKVQLHKYPGEIPNLSKNLEKISFDLMYRREYVDDSGKQAHQCGLLPSRQYKKSLYTLNPDYDDIVLPKIAGNNICANIVEWGRLNFNQIPTLFARLRELSVEDLGRFWLPKIRIYSSLSDIYFNMKNIRIIVSDLERSLTMRKERIEFDYQASEKKKLLQLQQHRVNLVHHVSVSQSNKQKIGVHQYVQDLIPGDLPQKNKGKAAKRKRRMKRSRSEDPVNFVNRKKLQLARHKAELQPPVDLRSKLQPRY